MFIEYQLVQIYSALRHLCRAGLYGAELHEMWWRMESSGMLRRVALVRTDVSEDLSTSFRVTRIGELGTTLAVTSNRRTLRRNSSFFIVTAVKTSNVIWNVRFDKYSTIQNFIGVMMKTSLWIYYCIVRWKSAGVSEGNFASILKVGKSS
jgi:hypothetical protein